MTGCSFSSGRLVAVMVLAALSPLPLQAADSAPAATPKTPEAPRTQAVESTAPPDMSSILDRFPERPESFDSLFRRDEGPALMRPAPQPMPRRRSADPLDDPETWALTTPQEAFQDFIARRVLEMPQYGPDGRDRTAMSSMERMYERFNRGPQTNSSRSVEWLGFRLGPAVAQNEAAGQMEPVQLGNIPTQLAPPSLDDLATRRFSNVNMQDNPVAKAIERAEQQRSAESFRNALNLQPLPAAPTITGLQPMQPSSGPGWNANPLPMTPAIAERTPRPASAPLSLPGLAAPRSGLPSLPAVPGVPGLNSEVDQGETIPTASRIELPRMTPGAPRRDF
jgi:hypothetical protein